MLSPSAMADSIRSSMGFPTPVSTQLTGWATGIINEITSNAQVTNAPGTVTGTCPPTGGPLSGGAASGGMISGMSGSRMASGVASAAGYPSVSSQLSAFCTQIVSHIQSQGIVAFSSGDITGSCTNSNSNPGTLVAGAGSNGQISGLSGSTLASNIHSAVGYPAGVSSELMSFCNAIVNYIMSNGVAAYASGSVTGTCPSGGGSLAAGSGSSGTIS